MGEKLWRLVLVNKGVKLTVEGSEVLPMLNLKSWKLKEVVYWSVAHALDILTY